MHASIAMRPSQHGQHGSDRATMPCLFQSLIISKFTFARCAAAHAFGIPRCSLIAPRKRVAANMFARTNITYLKDLL